MSDFTHNKFTSQILSNLTQAIFYTDLSGKLTYANRACERFRISECYGQDIDQLSVDAGLLKSLQQLRELAQAEQQSVTSYLSLPEAASQYCAVHCHRLLDESDVVTGFAYVIEGVSPEQVRDRILVTNLLENCQDLIYFKDLDSKFLCCSQSLADRFEANSTEEMVGKCDFDYLNHDCSKGFYRDEQEIIRTGEPLIGQEEDEPHPDGTVTWVMTTKMPLRGLDGDIIGTFGISKDITQQKEFEIELEKTNKQLVHASRHAGMAEVATNVLHNVGNVLNSVNTSFSQVQEITSRTNLENIDKLADIIDENAQTPNFLQEDPRGKQISSYLKKFASQMTKDRTTIEKELTSTKRHLEHIKTIVAMQQQFATSSQMFVETNLCDLLEDAVSISSSSLIRHNISLVREYSEDVSAWVDRHQVLQILVNLIRNAKHACQAANHSDLQIRISVNQSEEATNISITDNGIGIAPENLLNLFNHGFTTKENGHGFGLHSGANCAKSMGGSLVASSEGLGHGATFTLSLPVHQNEASANQPTDDIHPVDKVLQAIT